MRKEETQWELGSVLAEFVKKHQVFVRSYDDWAGETNNHKLKLFTQKHLDMLSQIQASISRNLDKELIVNEKTWITALGYELKTWQD